jgi:hypothetical protein
MLDGAVAQLGVAEVMRGADKGKGKVLHARGENVNALLRLVAFDEASEGLL